MSTRDRQLASLVAVVLVALAGWFLFVAPTRGQAGKLQTRISSEQSALTQAETEVSAGLSAESQYTTLVRQLRSIETAVPEDGQIPKLINELQAAAIRNRVGFQAVSLSSGSSTAGAPGSTSTAAASTPTGSSTTFPGESFSLQFTGRYFTIVNLLGAMARFVISDNQRFKATGRLLTISSVSFGAGKSGFPGVTASVAVSDYDVPSTLLGTATTSTATGTPTADVISK
jgi:hypothetical protein